MNPFSNPGYLLPPLIVTVISLALLTLVLMKGGRDFRARIFCCVLVSLTVYALSTFGMRSSPDVHRAFIWEKALIVAHYAMCVFFYHFTLAYTNIKVKGGVVPALYSFLVVVAALTWANLLVQGMRLESYGYAPIIGPLTFPMFAAIPLLIGGGVYNLIKGYKASISHEARNRMLYLAIAAFFPVLGVALDAFSPLPPAAIWGHLILCVICTIAILKYHLLDIRIVLRQGLVYLLVSALIAIPFVGIVTGVPHGLKEQLPLWSYILLVITLAFILQPLWRKVQDWVERKFYRYRYGYIKKLQEFSRQATGLTEVKDIANLLLNTLASAVGTDKAYLFLYSSSGDFASVASTRPSDSNPSLARDSPLIHFMQNYSGFLLRSDFDIIPQLQALASVDKSLLFQEMAGEVFIPLKTKTEFIGLLILGPKSNGQLYSSDDLQILSSTLPQLTISLDNARLYEIEKQRALELDLLGKLSAIVTSELDVNKVYQAFVSELRHILPIDYACIVLIEMPELKFYSETTFSGVQPAWTAGESIPLEGTATAWVSKHQCLHYEPDLTQKREFWTDGKLLEKGIKSVVCLPLYAKEGIIGSFVLGSQEPNAYAEDNLRFLQQVASQVAVAIERSQLYTKERQARVEMERQNKESLEFIDTLTHEVKTPLTVILASSELLAAGLSANYSPLLSDLAKNLDSGAHNLNQRVSELLDFAKMQRAQFVINLQPVDVPELIKDIADQMSPLLQSAGQNLSLELPDSLPEVKADPERLGQVLLNLLTNASKFSPTNSNISIRAYPKDAYLVVEVVDSAPPIEPEEAKLLFTPYFRSKQTKTYGLGLGLSICKHLVELHGGKIWVESQDKGNIFSFSLPMAV